MTTWRALTRPANLPAFAGVLIGLAIAATPASAQDTGEDKALGRPAVASSVEGKRPGGGCNKVADCAPSNVTDGDDDTRWSSEYSDPQFWQVDLGSPRLVDRLSLLWHRAHSAHYLISTSLDGVDFTTVADVSLRLSEDALRALSESRRLRDRPAFPVVSARYVRITSLERAPVLVGQRRLYFGNSLWEARVLGPPDDTGTPPPLPPAVPPPTQASDFEVVGGAQPEFETRGSGPAASPFPVPPAVAPLRAESAPTVMSPFPVVRLKGSLTARGAAIELLSVSAPRAATVRVRCSGRGCPARVPARRGSVRVRELRRTLRAGVVLEVFVTQLRRYGKYTRFEIQKGRPPRRTDRCVLSGSTRPVRCPGT